MAPMRIGLGLGLASGSGVIGGPGGGHLITGDGYPGDTITSPRTGQWFLDGVPISGQSGTSLVLAADTAFGKILTQAGGSNSITTRRFLNIGQFHYALIENPLPGNTVGTYRHRVRMNAAAAGKAIRLGFSNGKMIADGANFNPIALRLSVEVAGDPVPVLFGGNIEGAIVAGETLFSDPVTVTTPDFVYLRTCPKVTSGQSWPSGIRTYNATGEGASLGVDLTAPGSAAVTAASSNQGFGAMAAIAKYAGPSVLLTGDSLAFGQGGGSSIPGYPRESNSDTGWPMQSLNHEFPVMRFSKIGSTAAQHGGTICDDYYGYSNYFIYEAGINSITLGVDLETLKAQTLAILYKAKAAGNRVDVSTILPNNQATSNVSPGPFAAIIIAYNDWVRSKPYPIDYVIEASDAACTARNSEIYKPGFSTDWLHLNNTGCNAVAAEVGPALRADIYANYLRF